MEDEYKFQLIIQPESYDYVEEEIVYRIYYDKQLISERSIPVLRFGQMIAENFFLKSNKKKDNKLLLFKNTTNKKCNIKELYLNDNRISLLQNVEIKGLLFSIIVS